MRKPFDEINLTELVVRLLENASTLTQPFGHRVSRLSYKTEKVMPFYLTHLNAEIQCTLSLVEWVCLILNLQIRYYSHISFSLWVLLVLSISSHLVDEPRKAQQEQDERSAFHLSHILGQLCSKLAEVARVSHLESPSSNYYQSIDQIGG